MRQVLRSVRDVGYRNRFRLPLPVTILSRTPKEAVGEEQTARKAFQHARSGGGEDEPWNTMDSKPAHRTAKSSAQNLGPPASQKQAELQQKSNNSKAYQDASKARKAEADRLGMQPFEWIGPDHTSMSGPVTYARAMRGEIPMRPGNPNQKLATGYDPEGQNEESGATGSR